MYQIILFNMSSLLCLGKNTFLRQRKEDNKNMDFKKNGYIIVKSVFTKDECDKILDICKNKSQDGVSILNLDREIPEIKDFITDGRVADIVEQCYGEPMDYILTHIILKLPGTDFGNHAWN